MNRSHKLLGVFGAVLLAMTHHAVAEMKGQKIEYKDGNTVLEGYLAYDDSVTTPRPGVLVIHEWWGNDGYSAKRADMLAKLGYVAFALDMYGKGVVTNDPAEAGKLTTPFRNDPALMRRRATAGLDILMNNPLVDKTHVAAIGYCFGGTCALELARSGAPLVGTVGFHAGLDTKNPDDAKNIKGKVLICTGGDDPMVTSEKVTAFEEEMRKGNVDWQVNVYGGAVHAFTNPAADAHHIKGIGYNKEADQRSWEAMKLFFGEVFGTK